MDFNKEVKNIYERNSENLNKIIDELAEKELMNITKFVDIENSIKVKLKLLIINQLIEKTERQIEHKLIIETLYSDEMKEEAYLKLPQYILALR